MGPKFAGWAYLGVNSEMVIMRATRVLGLSSVEGKGMKQQWVKGEVRLLAALTKASSTFWGDLKLGCSSRRSLAHMRGHDFISVS